jgi:hypothetical protein
MSHPLATYSFLPWLRQGLANQITAADFDMTVQLRAGVRVDLKISGDGVSDGTVTQTVGRDVALFGPGDIVGIDTREIFRVEPRNWITNFETNYLAHIEFYDEDFPWRYTPAAPDVSLGRLRPWIMIVVLAETEFAEGKDIRNKPLPYVEVADANAFPPAEQLWAWAHVHLNRSLAASDEEFTSNDMNAVLPRLQAALNENPDLGYSRIVCPRKLAENAAYHAFLVPVFETGRLAGLGLDPAGSPSASFSAWAAYPAGTKPETQNFPYYFRWFFRTGKTGDFESLVRLLQPKPVNKRVGTRDMDVQDPGSNLPGITDQALNGILKLGGALRVPRENFTPQELVEVNKYENWAQPYPRPFQEALARLIDLADDYAAQSAEDANSNSGLGPALENDPDPLITPPLYGTWHALTKRLLRDRDGDLISPNDNWVHELNLDPRHRVAAGFGTRVVQEQQEKYMDHAWGQVGQVLEANRRIRFAQLAKAVSSIWYERHLLPLHAVNREKAFMMTAPMHKRVRASEFTVHHKLSESLVQPAMMSVALRRVLRPRGRLLTAMPFEGNVQPGNLLARVNEGEVSAAPPKVMPPGITTVNQVADQLLPRDAPREVQRWLRRYPWIRFMPLVVAMLILVLMLLIAPGVVALGIAFLLSAGLFLVYRRLSAWQAAISGSDQLREENQTPESVNQLPRSPDFIVSQPGSGFRPRLGSTDSVEAKRFKSALKDAYSMLAASALAGAVTPKKKLNLSAVAQATMQEINPERTIPKRVWHGIHLPARISLEMLESFVEAMAYPVFDTPMYKPLTDISDELFLPNINLIEQNSITLLETNQKFIEAYMVGLNHEFSRELLWREYPTDQRGSYFRQFWDVSGFFNIYDLTNEELKEKLRDIPKLHLWSRFSALGDHDNRELGGDKEEEIVLVIRGELLKRYPTAVIYAHRARWQTKDGKIDNKQERRFVELSEEEEAKPPRDKVRMPLYEAKVEPDIYFLGFDLAVEAAKGGTGENPDDDPGWFFVIKERPGDPRFGLDIDEQPQRNVWNDLSWQEVEPGPPGSFIQITNATPPLGLKPVPDTDEKFEQYNEDVKVLWKSDMSSADLAYVLFQAPVLIGVHAAEMLTRQ